MLPQPAMASEANLSDLSDRAHGVLPSQLLAEAVAAGWVGAGELLVPPSNIQPASLDLRLGERAYRVRCSFLAGDKEVEHKVKDFIVDELDLRREGAVLETGRPYLVPLAESLALPPFVKGKANPKSSTGRLDVFTRVITDYSYRFDEIAAGYEGPLYVEIVPLSFAVRVRQGLPLNQLRLMAGRSSLNDEELWQAHNDEPLLYVGGRPADRDQFATANGLFLSLDVRSGKHRRVGYRAKEHTLVLDMAKTEAHRVEDYWEEVFAEEEDRVVLGPERFYLLLSEEAVSVPPGLACEMTAYDPTSGELRTHYAGFFDPGFGYNRDGTLHGSRAALEVRAHDVPFMIEDGQQVCKLTYERMAAEPVKLYGEDIGSNYQGQVDTLSKHFRRDEAHQGSAEGAPPPQLDLFAAKEP
jgi:dCTP deaminase